ncbi:hypothetical protein VARIO8X_60571 [Burkholderiales bacterium 8X]|nr:hypothetical protein VARIO8X_60571 [Burkholderiales bacterium 8X]
MARATKGAGLSQTGKWISKKDATSRARAQRRILIS